MLASLVKATTVQTKIARLTLNHGNKRNALSRALLEQLQTHLKRIETNDDIRVVIIDANGPVFSSGHDLNELKTSQEQENTSLMEFCSSVMQTVVTLKKPVIAQVEGIATAAGCQLVASCDLAYASNKARFATPGVDIGLFCSTPAVALGRCVHRKHAMSMLLTGDTISAKEAEKIGLINAVIDSDDTLDDEVLKIATKIASKSPKAIEMGKPLFYKQLEMPLDAAYQLASKTMVENMNHDEAKEGIDAFLTKRKPGWSTTD
uniref:Enoyl-CoA hydratase domain-containing protein 3, mitochondrial n=1 Tax=Pseudo-nitzschia delicatissima TaxID=44447 RepID=A0A7S0XLH2_9STRA|mmetsp:Transcript_2295/g.5441  ORF Transcript_2295/g.5441 Transcript_2295/m.5441 type:complete len:262 (+) Transcript_2295:372-1157(+)